MSVTPAPLYAESIILYLEAALADTIHEKRDHKPSQTAALDALVNVASYKYKELYERYYELTLQVGVARLCRCHNPFSPCRPPGGGCAPFGTLTMPILSHSVRHGRARAISPTCTMSCTIFWRGGLPVAMTCMLCRVNVILFESRHAVFF